MDRRYGSDPLAPPRPPKSLPRVHRPRAPEPPIMSEPLQPHSLNVIHTQPQQSAPPPPQQQQQQQQLPPPPPATAPLVSLQSSTSFSRRRPPPPATTIQIPTIASLSSNFHSFVEAPISPVTLAEPRPENERLANEYVDTPFRTPPSLVSRIHHHHGIGTAHLSTNTSTHHHHHNHNHQTTTTAVQLSSTTTGSSKPIVPPSSTTTTTAAATTTVPSTQRTAIHRPNALPVITKQPMSFTKDLPTAALHEDVDIHPSNGESLNSITCPQCKRCRCEECQRPRQLPSRWVCDNSCLCSAETIIDYTSCLCCVKALFYHCSKDHEMERDGDSISCADDPCSCLPHKRTQRWAWLGALSIALPCLWCYWPMRGCVALCAKCYARHSRHGCRCPQNKINNISGMGNGNSGGLGGSTVGRTISRTQCDLTPEKRLLDSSPEY